LLKNCDVCGKVFAHPARSLCEECYRKAQARFQAVKEYLQKNPGATVAEVSEATETDVDVIYEYIREGRLSVIPRDAALKCEICGAVIQKGRICHKCLGELEEIAHRSKDDDDSRVRYLDQIKRRR